MSISLDLLPERAHIYCSLATCNATAQAAFSFPLLFLSTHTVVAVTVFISNLIKSARCYKSPMTVAICWPILGQLELNKSD